MSDLISIGMNRKLKAGRVVVFNLPAIKTCGRACKGCYAAKAERIYPSAKAKREYNLQESIKSEFADRMIAEITKRVENKYNAFRWHESGDFYSQAYVDAVAKVVNKFPDIKFYAYTKRLKEFDFSALIDKKNFVLIDSLQFGDLNYGTEEEIQPYIEAGAFKCPASKTITCGHGCSYCFTKDAQRTGVVFKKH